MENIVVYLMMNKLIALEKMKKRNGWIIEMEKMKYVYMENKPVFTPLPDWRVCKYSDEDIKILEELGEPVDDNDYYYPEWKTTTNQIPKK